MNLTFTRLHPTFVAEVSGLDLRSAHDTETLERIRAGMDEHAILVFRAQPFTDAEQLTDSAWKALLDSPKRPESPAWLRPVMSARGDAKSKTPTVIAGLIMLLVGLLWWLLFHRHPRWTTWFIGVIPFAITLAIFYFYLERALPANY